MSELLIDIVEVTEAGAEDSLLDPEIMNSIEKNVEKEVKIKIGTIEIPIPNSTITEDGKIALSNGKILDLNEFMKKTQGFIPDKNLEIPLEPVAPDIVGALDELDIKFETGTLEDLQREINENFEASPDVQQARERFKKQKDAENISNRTGIDSKNSDKATGNEHTYPNRAGTGTNKVPETEFATNPQNQAALEKPVKNFVNDTADKITTAKKEGTPVTPESLGWKQLGFKAGNLLIDAVAWFGKKIPLIVALSVLYAAIKEHQKSINGCYFVKTDKNGRVVTKKISLLTCGEARTQSVNTAIMDTCKVQNYPPNSGKIQSCDGKFNSCAAKSDTVINRALKDDAKNTDIPYVPNVCSKYYADSSPETPIDGVTVTNPTCPPSAEFVSPYCDSSLFFLNPGEDIKIVNLDLFSSAVDMGEQIGLDILTPFKDLVQGPGSGIASWLKNVLITVGIVIVLGLVIFWVINLLRKKTEKSVLG